MRPIKRILSFCFMLVLALQATAQNFIEIPSVKSKKLVESSTNGGPSLISGDFFGRSVAGIGDLNNDGINDIAVGANQDNTGFNDAGAVYICFMNANGSIASSVKLAHGVSGMPTLAGSDFFGTSVAGLGDLNGDTYEDIAVGANNTDRSTLTNCGSVFIIFLNASAGIVGYNEITTGSTNIGTLSNNRLFGASLANIGDINGDGTNDIAVGAPGGGASLDGSLWTLRLKANGTVKGATEIKEGSGGFPSATLNTSDLMGTAIAGGKDLNSDGFYDIVAGATGDDAIYSNSGALYILYLDTSGTVIITPKKLCYPLMSNNYFPDARDVGFGGGIEFTDINEDGITDLVTGVRTQNTNTGGMYFMVLDSAQDIQAIREISFNYAWDLNPPATASQFASSICEIDLGATGHKQYIVGANIHKKVSTQEGAFYYLIMDSLTNQFPVGTLTDYVKISDFSGNFTATLANSDFFGNRIEAIGDINNDGIDDYMAGARGNSETGRATSGAVYTLFMAADGKVNSFQKIAHNVGSFGTTDLTAGDAFGYGITSIGDFNANGVNDVAVGAPFNKTNDTGAVYIIRLTSSGTVASKNKIDRNSAHLTLATSDQFGFDVDTIGDLNKDGIIDLVVGAPGNDDGAPGSVDHGAVYIVFLKSDGTVKKSQCISDTQGSFTETMSNNDKFGYSVAGIGDIDGDTIPDIAVGSLAMNNTGAVHIITLDTNGVCTGFKKINTSGSNFPYTLINSEQFGSSVASVPDIDGNGVRDLIIGQASHKVFGLTRGNLWMTMLDSLGNVLDAIPISDSVGKFYTNTNASYSMGESVAFLGLDSLNNVKIGFGGRDDDGGTDRGAAFIAHILSSYSLMPVPTTSYAQLFREPDGGYYGLNGNFRLYFEYRSEYTANTLQYKIYNQNRQIVKSTSTSPGLLYSFEQGGYSADKVWEQNKFFLDLKTLSAGYYLLEIMDEKNDRQYLRFRVGK